MEHFFEAGTLTARRAGRPACAARRSRRQAVPAGLHVGAAEHRRAAAARRDRRLPAVAGRAPVSRRRPGRRRGRATGATRRARSSAFVWKTIADPFAGRITMFRVVSGVLKADSTVHNMTQGRARAARPPDADAGQDADERAGDQGRRPRRRREAEGHADQRRAWRQERSGRLLAALKFPEPVLAYAIEPKSRGDEDKISTSMHRLEEEDPVDPLQPRSADQELLLSGQGQLHIEVTVAKLKRRFGVDVNLKPPRIPYRETIKPRHRGARPAQETDRRPRPVRRLQDQGRAAGARLRLRVRGRHLRRLDSAPVRSGGGERHSGTRDARLPRRLSRWSTSGSRCSTARTTTSTRTSCRSRWRAARVQGRDDARAADDPRAGDERRGLRAVAISPAT